jgi:hypothetical protein
MRRAASPGSAASRRRACTAHRSAAPLTGGTWPRGHWPGPWGAARDRPTLCRARRLAAAAAAAGLAPGAEPAAAGPSCPLHLRFDQLRRCLGPGHCPGAPPWVLHLEQAGSGVLRANNTIEMWQSRRLVAQNNDACTRARTELAQHQISCATRKARSSSRLMVHAVRRSCCPFVRLPIDQRPLQAVACPGQPTCHPLLLPRLPRRLLQG